MEDWIVAQSLFNLKTIWHWTPWTCHLHNGTWCVESTQNITEWGFASEIQHFQKQKSAACNHYHGLNVHKLLCVGYVCDLWCLAVPKQLFQPARQLYWGTLGVPASCWLPHVPEKTRILQGHQWDWALRIWSTRSKMKAEGKKRKAWNRSSRLALALLDLLAPRTQTYLPLSLKRFKTFKRSVSTTTVCLTLSASPTCNWVRLENVKRNLEEFDQD